MIAVIGDIHGCFNTLKALIKKIKEKYSDIKIYSVGDLIDRGNFSFEVLEFVIKENIIFTCGNHDIMFYYFIKFPKHPLGKIWLYNGSETTLLSYQDRVEKIDSHLSQILKAPLFIDHEDCFISHAGISKYYKAKLPQNILENLDSVEELMREQIASEHGILWTRDELINLGKLQIIGHTRKEDVVINKNNNTVYIDTSVYTGNKLTVVIVNKGEIIDQISVPTFEIDIN
ncbi:MAG: metallophosphoesterase [Ignavibacteriaceae bacterium]